ncbi:MAG: HAD family hydrolase [Tetrasphaera sp.]
MPPARPRVIATDLDGTLLRSDGTVSDRTVSSLNNAAAAGILTILVTARPPRWLHDLAHVVGEHGVAICANGAFVYDVVARRVTEAHVFDPSLLARVVAELRAVIPGIRFAAESPSGCTVEPGWPDPHRDAASGRARRERIEEVVLSPAAADGVGKLLALAPGIAVEDFFAAVSVTVGQRALLAYSGATGLAELNPPGVTKAAGLERWCRERAIAAADVWAFGDMPNDIPMLRWAGRSFAVANAHNEVHAIATHSCPSNDEDGVARVIDAVLG